MKKSENQGESMIAVRTARCVDRSTSTLHGRRAKQESRKLGSRERRALAFAIDALSTNIAILDENGFIVAVNKAWMDFARFNLGAAERVGENSNYLAVCEQAAGPDMEMARRFSDGIRAVFDGSLKEFSLEYPCHSPSEKRWFVGRVTRFVVNHAKYAVVAHDDITQRKLAEEAVRSAKLAQEKANQELELRVRERTAELQRAVEELLHFSYTITHDMRAPLRAITGFAELIGEESGLSSSNHAYLARIREAARRMDELILDALDYNKLTHQAFELTEVDPEPLLRGIIQSYPAFQTPSADIAIDGSLPPILANEAGLTQCFSNLLNNAVKFVQPGKTPRVRIRAELLGSSQNPLSQTVRLWFEDNGVGIAPEAHEKVFGMFQRLSTAYAGTGIGLALVKKAAERMEGKVGLESAPGIGSRFWLEFKRAPINEASAPAIRSKNRDS